ncbi:hypothetical protein [Polyangium sp. 15x6]|uniref:hypothetical protein n=1 Tax=Polyangium sp. 15x6 TaxID=3042687 RepID=UPI00249B6D8C|nr:hypothetical protein [Polyangium sp. 15x6]MDI3288696.1 hypothetical protein [Polyangium sp. 15x6]
MNRFVILLLVVAPALYGCAMAGDAAEEAGSEDVGTAEDEINILNSLLPNALVPNALVPNSLVSNGLAPSSLVSNALAPGSLSSGALAAIQDAGQGGEYSRLFVQYAVSCAFTSSQSFSFSWTDSLSVVHNETYWGAIGLASGWATGSLSLGGQRAVTACLAARTNLYGTSVTLSARHPTNTALATSPTERVQYPLREGAFWGNLFLETPEIYSCYDPNNVADARSQVRFCAAGDNSVSPTAYCSNIVSVGACSDECLLYNDPNPSPDPYPDELGYFECDNNTSPITTFFNIAM